MLDQIENYICKALLEESKGDDKFLTESEIAFRVTGMLYKDKVKSDGPVSLRAIRGKMPKVRIMCDLEDVLLLPKVVKGEEEREVAGWKIATPSDISYLGEVYFGIVDDAEEVHAETKPGAEKESNDG